MTELEVKSIILEKMKDHFGNRNIQLPSKIKFHMDNDDTIVMQLSANSIEDDNMQVDSNAFEGWAIGLYAAMGRKEDIILDVYGDFRYDSYVGHGHFSRFLYRAWRFSEQYDWFRLSDYLTQAVDKFRMFIEEGFFTNNLADGEAGVKQEHDKENAVEADYASPGVLQQVLKNQVPIGDNPVYRQLPVGLFKDTVSKSTSVFTHARSAIDLWTWNGDVFYPIELKVEKRMIGIITEIFFYSNYMLDLLGVNGAFRLNEERKAMDRGYSVLIENSFDKIEGIMLADDYHPLVNTETLDVLNSGKETLLHYHMAIYK